MSDLRQSTGDHVVSSSHVIPGNAGFGTIRAGEFLRVTDVEGAQVADFFAWKQEAPHRNQDMGLTWMDAQRWRLGVGDVLVDTAIEPMWTITQDTVGKHLFGGGCCTRIVNQKNGDDQDGCAEIVKRSLVELGLDPGLFEQIIAANLFAGLGYQGNGDIVGIGPSSRAGDSITFRAEVDMYWVLVCCPYQSDGVHGGRSTPHFVEVLGA